MYLTNCSCSGFKSTDHVYNRLQ